MWPVRNVRRGLVRGNRPCRSICGGGAGFAFGFCCRFSGISMSICLKLLGLSRFCIQISMGRILHHLGISCQSIQELGIGMGLLLGCGGISGYGTFLANLQGYFSSR
jgi:hypothetical protein